MSVGSVFKAISDPTRREILKLLNEKDLSAGEIAEHFDISKPALTKHLNILREAELVSSEKQGNFVIYSINVTVLQQALSGFMSILEKRSDLEMKKSIFILDICIFGLSITALLIAFFKNLSNVNFLIGAGLISLMGVAQTRMAVITNLSKDNPKVKTMRRMNRLTVILAVALYFVPLIDNDFIVNIPTSFIFVVTIMLFTGNVSTKLPLNKYMGLRLPWTTTDEKTWKIANRLLGYITFPLVFIMLILYFITEQSELVLFIGLVIWVGIPTIYSFIKQKKTN